MPERKVLTRDEWRALEEKGLQPVDAALRKAWACDEVTTKAEDPKLGDREVQLVISTSKPDRDNDVINADGWKLTNYKKNPVVLFAHDYRSLPIARARKIMAGDGVLRAIDHFVEREVYPLAEIVLQMLKRGYLNAASVGFAPVKWLRNEDRGGYDFEEQELLEHSIVPVPANAGALVEMRQIKGLDLVPYVEWCEHFLDEHGTQLGKDLPVDPRKVAEMLKAAQGGRIVFAYSKDPQAALPKVEGFTIIDVKEGAPATPPAPKSTMLGDPEPEGPDVTADARYIERGGLFLKQGFTVQTLIFPKAHWASAAECKQWARDHNFRADKVDETETSYRLRQRDPEDFSRLRTICVNPGDVAPNDEKCKVKAVGGPLKASEEPKLALPVVDRSDVDAALVVTEWLHAQERGVIAYRRTPLAPEAESWDGPAEVAAADVNDLKAMSAWMKGDGEQPADYLLAHHQAASDHACVWRGVANAAARIPQLDLPPADLAGIRRHLGRHYEDFGKTAPWQSAPASWEKYESLGRAWSKAAGRELTPGELASLLRECGFEAEARAVDAATETSAVGALFQSLGIEVRDAVEEPADPDLMRAGFREAIEAEVDARIARRMGRLD